MPSVPLAALLRTSLALTATKFLKSIKDRQWLTESQQEAFDIWDLDKSANPLFRLYLTVILV